ncbi:MAG: hypothetical protein EXQ52_11640 [Bryobacterales bacterium]|nr:hypothetical protein [Bryobacterales bacterium]
MKVVKTMSVVLTQAAILAALQMPARAQDAGTQPEERPSDPSKKVSFALEADALAYGLKGYSGIVNVTLPNGLQFAFGEGRYDVPGFLVNGDKNYDQAKWNATVTGVQVFRTTYRFKGPMKSGPAVGGILLNQSWRLRSDAFAGETKFRELSGGITGGYYWHLTKHFYVYPTAAYTYNTVTSGQTSLGGLDFHRPKFSFNGSVHIGWAF